VTDPTRLTDALAVARDSFRHAHGAPTFEPGVDSSPDADEGIVQVQKACRLLGTGAALQDEGAFCGSVLEHAFAAIERTLEGYLIAFADYEVRDFHDHAAVYDRGRQQVPLESETLEVLEALYDDRRTEHYYGTTVTTERQAEAMLDVATALHDHIVQFDTEVTRYCQCSSG